MLKITNNEGTFYTHKGVNQVRKDMFAYIRSKLAKGVKLRNIIYSYGRIS